MSAEKPRERPILFNDQMVRAILDGRKTVTRRVMKPQPMPSKSGGHNWPCKVHQSMLHVERELQNGDGCWCGLAEAACPYGQPGDRLWVREAWACTLVAQAPGEEWVVYREGDNRTDYGGPWKPSIHMPRWASRILLEITAVRVERLQDISNDQAIAEGIDTHPMGFYGNGCITAGGAFLELWESINGDGRWADNPWVWVIEFKRVAP